MTIASVFYEYKAIDFGMASTECKSKVQLSIEL